MLINYIYLIDAYKLILFKRRQESLENFNEAWGSILEYCKSQISDVAYTTWFTRLKPITLDFENGEAIIEAPNDFHKQTVVKCYSDLINDAFQTIFGSQISFQILVKDEISVPQTDSIDTENGDYELTFETFLDSPSNRFAKAACQAVAEDPATNYNPLFIYGNSGLGKTHLLHAISNEIAKNFSNMSIVYIKGDDFTNEMIDAIRSGTTANFREKYRQADVLLVDDIQFIAGKDSTQEEFFHTFNSLYEAKKQIILTSDRPPKDISTLEDRLKTRFEWGLTSDIQPPEFETRVAIINQKAKFLNIDIPENVAEYVANKLKNNIRQLEGAVKKLKAYHYLEKKPLNITTAQAAISDIINNNQPTPVTVDKIIEEVGRTYGVSPEDITSQKRKKEISMARQISMYIVREITQMSMEDIGKTFGNRDHSTVVYAISKVEQNINNDPHQKATIEDIIKNIRDR